MKSVVDPGARDEARAVRRGARDEPVDPLAELLALERRPSRGEAPRVRARARRPAARPTVVTGSCGWSWSWWSWLMRLLQPVLEHVGEETIVCAASVRRPELALLEADEVQPLGRLAVLAVRARLGVEEALVHPLDRAGLAPSGSPAFGDDPRVRRSDDAHRVAWSEAHRATRSSSSPGASTPFSVRIVSVGEEPALVVRRGLVVGRLHALDAAPKLVDVHHAASGRAPRRSRP